MVALLTAISPVTFATVALRGKFCAASLRCGSYCTRPPLVGILVNRAVARILERISVHKTDYVQPPPSQLPIRPLRPGTLLDTPEPGARKSPETPHATLPHTQRVPHPCFRGHCFRGHCFRGHSRDTCGPKGPRDSSVTGREVQNVFQLF